MSLFEPPRVAEKADSLRGLSKLSERMLTPDLSAPIWHGSEASRRTFDGDHESAHGGAWHMYMKDPSPADAILDRVVQSSHKIELKASKSMRKGDSVATVQA